MHLKVSKCTCPQWSMYYVNEKKCAPLSLHTGVYVYMLFVFWQ